MSPTLAAIIHALSRCQSPINSRGDSNAYLKWLRMFIEIDATCRLTPV